MMKRVSAAEAAGGDEPDMALLPVGYCSYDEHMPRGARAPIPKHHKQHARRRSLNVSSTEHRRSSSTEFVATDRNGNRTVPDVKSFNISRRSSTGGAVADISLNSIGKSGRLLSPPSLHLTENESHHPTRAVRLPSLAKDADNLFQSFFMDHNCASFPNQSHRPTSAHTLTSSTSHSQQPSVHRNNHVIDPSFGPSAPQPLSIHFYEPEPHPLNNTSAHSHHPWATQHIGQRDNDHHSLSHPQHLAPLHTKSRHSPTTAQPVVVRRVELGHLAPRPLSTSPSLQPTSSPPRPLSPLADAVHQFPAWHVEQGLKHGVRGRNEALRARTAHRSNSPAGRSRAHHKGFEVLHRLKTEPNSPRAEKSQRLAAKQMTAQSAHGPNIGNDEGIQRQGVEKQRSQSVQQEEGGERLRTVSVASVVTVPVGNLETQIGRTGSNGSGRVSGAGPEGLIGSTIGSSSSTAHPPHQSPSIGAHPASSSALQHPAGILLISASQAFDTLVQSEAVGNSASQRLSLSDPFVRDQSAAFQAELSAHHCTPGAERAMADASCSATTKPSALSPFQKLPASLKVTDILYQGAERRSGESSESEMSPGGRSFERCSPSGALELKDSCPKHLNSSAARPLSHASSIPSQAEIIRALSSSSAQPLGRSTPQPRRSLVSGSQCINSSMKARRRSSGAEISAEVIPLQGKAEASEFEKIKQYLGMPTETQPQDQETAESSAMGQAAVIPDSCNKEAEDRATAGDEIEDTGGKRAAGQETKFCHQSADGGGAETQEAQTHVADKEQIKGCATEGEGVNLKMLHGVENHTQGRGVETRRAEESRARKPRVRRATIADGSLGFRGLGRLASTPSGSEQHVLNAEELLQDSKYSRILQNYAKFEPQVCQEAAGKVPKLPKKKDPHAIYSDDSTTESESESDAAKSPSLWKTTTWKEKWDRTKTKIKVATVMSGKIAELASEMSRTSSLAQELRHFREELEKPKPEPPAPPPSEPPAPKRYGLAPEVLSDDESETAAEPPAHNIRTHDSDSGDEQPKAPNAEGSQWKTVVRFLPGLGKAVVRKRRHSVAVADSVYLGKFNGSLSLSDEEEYTH